MNATEILEADLERDERRKSEPFRREWAVSNVSTLSSKSGFVQTEDIALFFVGTNILHHVSKEEDKVIEKEHAIVSGKSSLDVLNFSTNNTNKVLEPSIDISSSDDECFIDFCDKQSAMIIPMPQLVKETDSFVLDQNACAENKQLLSIATEKDELKLLSFKYFGLYPV